jgi:16S rRNA (adenine1518-N6/adenine1519-N6)-dimethyltransferase
MNELQIKNLLRGYNLRPKDYLGQNFLVDDDALEAVAEAGDLKKGDVVLEIGPGLGVLTKLLAKRARRVIAVEKDKKLLPVLKREIKDFANVQIVNEDILRFNIGRSIAGPFKVVANIPYYLTSKLIYNLLKLDDKPEVIVLMIQKEVGERIVAGPGELSVLGLSVQFYADAEIVASVPANNFWPAPEVDSVIIRIVPKAEVPKIDDKQLFRVIKIAFAGKRKQIHNTLASGLKLSKEEVAKLLESAGVSPTARPQDLGLEDWIRLSETVGPQPPA